MNAPSQKSARLEADSNDPSLGRSLVFGWDRDLATTDQLAKQGTWSSKRTMSYCVNQSLVIADEGRLLGHLGPAAKGTPNATACTLRWNVSRPTDNVAVNTLSVVLNFPTDHALASKSVDDSTLEGPMDHKKMPTGMNMVAEGKTFGIFEMRAIKGAKPLVLGFPSEQSSMIAKFYVPLLKRQGHILVAIDDRAIGHTKSWCRNAALGPFRPVLGSSAA
ncbi:hypothetical protein PG996_007711 [Apiospora saccharicola]|uniref:Uncharacterized protein n=1 Tax=Apiospora saccharicola TaxID=335842 RepID=A0ABR1VF47_9PEZI